MHLSVQFNHFNPTHWVAVRCEASGASEAMPAVAEASEASGSYLYNVIGTRQNSVACRITLLCGYGEDTTYDSYSVDNLK